MTLPVHKTFTPRTHFLLGSMSKQDKTLKVEQDSDSERDEESDEEERNWWEQENLRIAQKGDKRWSSLSHNGVLFPPEYVPHGISIQYEGQKFEMTPDEEEVATMFAVLKETDHYRNPVFRQNFFDSWLRILNKRRGGHPIKRLELVDLEAIFQWHLREREKRLSRTKDEKKNIKDEQDAEAEPYRWCLWDGHKEQVANFRVEPPGLFRGRGKHPSTGILKVRVEPEDVTINIAADAEVPKPPAGHHWKAVQHDNTVTWLAMWRDSIMGSFKYVMLSPSSTIKGQSDMLKFEKARKLKDHIGTLRASYMKDFKSGDRHVTQRAVALYFIDKLALRVGNEKGGDEADTVGCCSLRVEHLSLKPGNIVKFDFLGKDSIRYVNEVEVLPEVFALLERFMRGKRGGDDIFDQLTTTQLNDHLKSFMDGLSAKVFRTYNASITLDSWFKEQPVNNKASIPDKLAYFNKANTEVAILCNHQKAVSKNHRALMAQLEAKREYTDAAIRGLEQARETAKKKSLEAAAKEFFAEQDRVQLEWLEAYGTEEQKKEYKEIMAKRGDPKVRSSSSVSTGKKKSSSSAGGTKTKKAKSAAKKGTAKKAGKKDAKKAAKKVAKKAAPAKKKAKKEEDSDEEMSFASLITKGTGKKRARAVKDEDSSDEDDVPLSAL